MMIECDTNRVQANKSFASIKLELVLDSNALAWGREASLQLRALALQLLLFVGARVEAPSSGMLNINVGHAPTLANKLTLWPRNEQLARR